MRKDKMYSMRFNEIELERIKKRAGKAKQSVTAYITNSALNKNIIIINGLDVTNRELKAIGRNLNQLTTLCNMGKIRSLDLMETKEQLRQVYTAMLDMNGR